MTLLCHFPDLGNALDWSNRKEICLNHSEALPTYWIVTSHRLGISAVIPQILFCSEGTCSDGVMKSRLFYQPRSWTEQWFLTVTGIFIPFPLRFSAIVEKKNNSFYSLKFYGYLTQAYHTQKLKRNVPFVSVWNRCRKCCKLSFSSTVLWSGGVWTKTTWKGTQIFLKLTFIFSILSWYFKHVIDWLLCFCF